MRLCLYETNVIPSGAMKDALLVGDHIISNPLDYRFRDPRPGEIVTFTYPFRDLTRAEKIRYVFNSEHGDGRSGGLRLMIKRVVGGPGDVVEIRRGILYRNGEQVREPYVLADAGEDFGPCVVPAGRYLAMGDNRDDSYDSRIFGPVPRKYIRGRPAAIYLSVAPASCPKHRAPIVRFGDGWRCTAGGEEMRPGLDFEPAPWWRLDRRIRWKRVGKRFAPPEAVAHKLNHICE
ncbi:MAG: signal peptidase I [candidate division Zixibacteria bacterium]|nr:signal peptidase I [candidate division Zixibacteria bacterium]